MVVIFSISGLRGSRLQRLGSRTGFGTGMRDGAEKWAEVLELSVAVEHLKRRRPWPHWPVMVAVWRVAGQPRMVYPHRIEFMELEADSYEESQRAQ